MFCNVCGSEIPEGSVNCPVCGSPVMNSAPTQPQDGFIDPQTGYAQSQDIYAQPQATYPQTQGEYPQQPFTYSQPQTGYTQPQTEYAQPQANYTQAQTGYTQPQPGYVQPQAEYAQPQTSGTLPQPGYAQPQPVYAQPQAPVEQPQDAAGRKDKPKKQKTKGRRRPLTVLSFTFCMISLAALTLTCIFPYWFHDNDSGLFYFVVAGIGFVALMAFILFLLARKNALTIISGVLSVVVIAGALIFALVIVPKMKDNLLQQYKDAMRHKDNYGYSRLDPYPYENIKQFASDKDNSIAIQNYLWDLFDEGNYSDWITATKYVLETSTYSSANEPARLYSEDVMKNKLWDKAATAGPQTLSYYTYLFEGTPLAESQDKYVQGFISLTKSSIEEYQYYQQYGYDAPPPYTGYSMSADSADTRIFGSILISEVHSSLPGGSAYVVVNLSNGEYFVNKII